VTAARRLAAILAADVVGYSRLMGADEAGTAKLVRERLEAATPIVRAFGGRVVKTTGDGVLLEFPSVVAAVECAIAIQKMMAELNAQVPDAKRILYRVGVNLGDVLVEGDDILGDGVNVAARLEGICESGGVCVSGSAYDHVRGRIAAEFVDLGEQALKNIAQPVRAYALTPTTIAILKAVTPPSTAKARGWSSQWPAGAAMLAAVAVLSLGGYAWHSGLGPHLLGPTVAEDKLANAPRLSIVVLPFENLTSDKEQDYFADAITDDLTTDLSHLHDSFVISRNTAFTYKGKPVDPKATGKELGVRYVLEGSVRQLGRTVEVNAQLISTETGAHVWADRFEGEESDLGKLQFEIVGRLARSLDLQLIRAESLRAVRERPSNPDAVDLRMRGEALVRTPNAGKSTWDEAQKLFERAHALDPRDARATWLLALALATRAQSRWSEDSPAGATFLSSVVGGATPGEAADIARAEQLVDAADALQPDEAWVHYTKGFIHHIKHRNTQVSGRSVGRLYSVTD
jgi:adenylate cyclase